MNHCDKPAEADEKKLALYLRQKAMLEQFLANGAISRAQFDKSFGDLTAKMGMEAYSGRAN